MIKVQFAITAQRQSQITQLQHSQAIFNEDAIPKCSSFTQHFAFHSQPNHSPL